MYYMYCTLSTLVFGVIVEQQRAMIAAVHQNQNKGKQINPSKKYISALLRLSLAGLETTTTFPQSPPLDWDTEIWWIFTWGGGEKGSNNGCW